MIASRPSVAIAMGESGAGHPLAEATLLNECLLELAELVVEEVVGLVDEAEGDVGDGFGGAGVGEIGIRPIGLIGPMTKSSDIQRFLGVLGPEAEAADAEEVLVIDEEFFEAGAGDADEFDLHFLGGAGGHATLDDVLLAGAGGLDHLVDGAVALGEEALAEAEGEVVDDFGLAVGEEFLVVAVRRDEAGRGHEEAE